MSIAYQARPGYAAQVTLPRSHDPAAPIGVFDSGVGGLTVVAAIRSRLPSESVLYLGDTARVPYGTKSPEVIRRYALTCSSFLVAQGAKLVVVACNTATAHALEYVRAALEVPVVGVITPGATLAARTTKTGRIGVIGTEGTVRSGSYQRALTALAPEAELVTAACPLFVPLAEEGMARHPATVLIARDYLAPLITSAIDTLVLGCTHYPLLRDVITEVVGPGVQLVDSASAVAADVDRILAERALYASGARVQHRFVATDVSERFYRVGRAFLGADINDVEHVDL